MTTIRNTHPRAL